MFQGSMRAGWQVFPVRWFVRQSKTDMVKGNTPVGAREVFDQIPKFKRPRRVPMDHHDRFSSTFINIAHRAHRQGDFIWVDGYQMKMFNNYPESLRRYLQIILKEFSNENQVKKA
jgi:hypothetical protein